MSDPSACPDEAAFAAFLEGTASPALREGIVAHLDGCAACRRLAGDAASAPPEKDADRQTRVAPLVAPAGRVLAAGSILGGRYRVGRVLGHGGWGTVYEAEQLALGRTVAIKVLDDIDAESLERFRAEARSTAKLAHANIVAVLDFEAEPGKTPFLVMERLVGDSLARVLAREGKLSPPRALSIASQILAGLEAAHAVGIIHRDVKPGNVFLVPSADGKDAVKVLDFGIAKVPDATWRTATGAMLGTPSYMAPEQLLVEPVDARTDVHAVGACLAEMLTGVRLYAASGDASSPARILDEAPRRVDASDRAAAAIAARAASRRPDDRYPSARAMREAIEGAGGIARTPGAKLETAAAPLVRMPGTIELAPDAALEAPRPRRKLAAERARSKPRPLVFGLSAGVAIAAGLAALVLATRHAPDRDVSRDASGGTIAIHTGAPDAPDAPDADGPDADEARSADGGRAAPITRRASCICRHRGGEALCATAQPPVCVCLFGSDELCPRPTDADGRCPVSRASLTGLGLATGVACKGYQGTWRGTTFAGPAEAVLHDGTLACNPCSHPTASPGTPGAPCRGIDHYGDITEGRFDCANQGAAR